MDIKQNSSFMVDHRRFGEGLYISRIDGDITTFDMRTRRPNSGDYMDNITMHTFEHMFSTYIRNTDLDVIFFGPMGCQTGFYFLFDGEKLSNANAVRLLQRVFTAAAKFDGAMPGASARECGNYRNLDVELARRCCAYYADVIADWSEEKLVYPEK